MDEKEFKARSARLEQVGDLLSKLPVEIRADAFALLKDYVTQGTPEAAKTPKLPVSSSNSPTAPISEEEFFRKFDHDKPADNVKLIAAAFYREYGIEPFSDDQVNEKAADVGITVPKRIDMTLINSKVKGKKLFNRVGRGMFTPTVHGEAHFKSTYAVTKGMKKRPVKSE